MVMDVKCLLGTSTYAGTRQNVSMARRWVRELLSGHIDEETLYDVTLCAAELADNARKHGPQGGAISLQCISAVTSFGLRSPMML
jgi:anti-sigma regulatory factor (Ser/Thr protein kinase)